MLLVLLLFVGFATAMVVSVVWAVRNTRVARVRRAMREVPRTVVSAVRPGSMVKLVGRVRLAGEPLRAPLTGRPCAYFHVLVQRRALDMEDDAFGRTTMTRTWVA